MPHQFSASRQQAVNRAANPTSSARATWPSSRFAGIVDSDPTGCQLIGTPIDSLDQNTCLALLATVSIGRVGWATQDGHAMILPVNFVLDGKTVVFSSGEGDKLDAIRQGRTITFEADAVELALQAGWSVLVIGTAEVITDPAEIHRIDQLHLLPWVSLPERVFVRLLAAEMTGRRLPLHPGEITIVRQLDP